MRLVTVRLVPADDAFSAVEQTLAGKPDVTREVIHHIKVLGDGTGTILCEFDGDRARLEAVLETHPDVIGYSVSEVGDRLYAYIHEEFPGDVGRLLAIQREREFIVDDPIEYGEDGSIQVTVIGELSTIRAAMDDVPETVGVSIVRIGDYAPGTERLFARLTKRQRDTVRAATRLGYFRDPREATYEDIGEAIGCGPETVGEHLRKAQETVFGAITPVE